MTHRSIHSKLLASTFAGLLSGAPVVLAGAVTLLNPDVAQAGVTSASCRIHAVEATPEGDGTIPKDLEFLAEQLQAPEFARFRGFRLVEVKDFKLELGKVVDQKFKSGHNVKLSLLGGEQEKLELHTELLRGGTSVVKMDILLKFAQVVLIPVRRGDQAIIFAYQCKS
ncbi:MAG TPA: hypothetical protein VK034_02615 [Enhygromyxa sp.]|nr:hypothetical protein [Enhygromyxa sp.]